MPPMTSPLTAERLAELREAAEADSGTGTHYRGVLALLADRERLEARAQAAEARSAALEEALRYGFNLYGYVEVDGPWPIARRSEFDRLARTALAARDGGGG